MDTAAVPDNIAGRYTILGVLGQGGMGAVYRARDQRLDRLVAIKTIRSELLTSHVASERFFREARAMAALNHPNVLTLYDYGQESDLHYLVMELGEQDLEHVVAERGGRLPAREAVAVALGICQALAYAHDRGIVHRDLKPGNILVGTGSVARPLGAESVKVMDFGLAKVQGAADLTGPHTRVGTPQYMSPEQALGQPADERSDLYALGVLLYELFTGARPFDGDNGQEILAQHLQLEPVPPTVFQPDLPEGVENLVLDLLRKDPTQRPTSAHAVVTLLGGLAQSLPADQAPPEPRQVPAKRLPARVSFVGRGDELAYLKQEFEATAAGGGGRLLLVGGDPGVGKTRLARELGTYARLRGARFAEGHYLREGNVPYGAWVDALRSASQEIPLEHRRDLAGPYFADLTLIFPELGGVPSEAAGTGYSPEEQRARLFAGVVEVIRGLAREMPLVLLLDDLQWAPGLSLLTHVARHVATARVMVLGTYRDQEFQERPELVQQWAELNRARLIGQVGLRPFSDSETHELIARYVGESAAAKLKERVHGQTRGNAFFIEEVLRSLAESQGLRPTSTSWDVDEAGGLRIPESMKLAVADRIARLGGSAREVLAQAAVLGQEFSFAALGALTGLPEEELLDLFDRAQAARILVDCSASGEERYAFWDDQIQEVLYESILPARRRRHHLRAGQALEEVYADRLDTQLEELARHFSEGNLPTKAADYAYQAAEKNGRYFNWRRAGAYYQQSADALAQLADSEENRRRQIDALMKRVSVTFFTDPPAENLVRLTRAETLAQARGGLGSSLAADDLKRLAGIQYWIGRLCIYHGEYPRAKHSLEQALHSAHASGDEQGAVLASSGIGSVLWMQGHFNQVISVLATTVERLDDGTDSFTWVISAGYLAVAHAAVGEYATGLAELQGLLARAQATRDPRRVAVCYAYLATMHFIGGDAARMLEASRVAHQVAEEYGELFQMHLGLGRQALAHSRLGEHVAAQASLEARQAVRQSLGGQLGYDDWFTAWEAEIAFNEGRIEDALDLAQRTVERARSIDAIFSEGTAHRVWAQSAATLDPARRAEAEEHLAAALRCFEEGEARLEMARTHLLWGQFLSGLGDPTAREHLEKAATQFEASGLDGELERTRLDLGKLPPPKGRVPTDAHPAAEAYPDGLTAREVEVLRLIAAGRSSKDIAEALVISVTTVNRHISNIYDKIGAHGRAVATAYALNHQLNQTREP